MLLDTHRMTDTIKRLVLPSVGRNVEQYELSNTLEGVSVSTTVSQNIWQYLVKCIHPVVQQVHF